MSRYSNQQLNMKNEQDFTDSQWVLYPEVWHDLLINLGGEWSYSHTSSFRIDMYR